MSSKSKLIAVSEKTYHDLAEMGTLEDSFNSVIERMIQKQKAAASGLTLAGTGQNAATAPQSTTGKGSRKQYVITRFIVRPVFARKVVIRMVKR